MSQFSPPTEEEKNKRQEEVLAFLKLGREQIIALAIPKIDIPVASVAFLRELPNMDISVWYNKECIWVTFKETSAIRYIPYKKIYAPTISVCINPSCPCSSAIHYLSSPKDYDSDDKWDFMEKEPLYCTTKKIEDQIEKVIELNNASDNSHTIDSTSNVPITIREHNRYYGIQIGNRYPITYKLKKKSGKVYDFDNTYGGRFFPTPIIPRPMKKNIFSQDWAGKRIELKE